MIIVKKPWYELSFEDIVFNEKAIENNEYIFNVAYTNEYNPTDEPIGHIECESKKDYFKEIIEWLNKEKYAALIWGYNKSYRRAEMPFFVDKENKLCFAYEGYLAITPSTCSEYLSKIRDFINPNLKKLDILTKEIVWVLEEALTMKDAMVFMDNCGNFKYIRHYNKYEYKNIVYCIYDTPFPPRPKIDNPFSSQNDHLFKGFKGNNTRVMGCAQ